MTFTIGADPEVFVKRNGKNVGVFETNLPGTKEAPFKTPNGALQQDGMAAEFNINPSPIGDFEAFNHNIVKTIGNLRDHLKSQGDFNLSIAPVADFDQEQMDNAPESAKELGCDPDFSAYTLAPNPRPEGSVNFRTGAGHIHIGWGADIPLDNPDHMEICAGFVKMCDATIGMFMTVIDREPRRRQLYGKAGAFRPKSYGVEYRTPSNVWIKNRETRSIVHFLLNKAVLYHSAGYTPVTLFGHLFPNIDQDEIRRIIDEGDAQKAEKLCDALLAGNKAWATSKKTLINEALKLAA